MSSLTQLSGDLDRLTRTTRNLHRSTMRLTDKGVLTDDGRISSLLSMTLPMLETAHKHAERAAVEAKNQKESS